MAGAPTQPHSSRFADRHDAGRKLAERLGDIRQLAPVIVGVAPSGMPIAAAMARLLAAPLDTVAVAPLSIDEAQRDRVGTVADGGVAFFDDEHAEQIDAQPEAVDAALIGTQQRLERHVATWHRGSRRHSLKRRVVVLVGEALEDEEIAAAACAIRDRGAARVIYATPQLRLAAALAVGDWVDQIVCLQTVSGRHSASRAAEEPEPVSDEQIRALLRENDSDRRATAATSPR